MLLCILNTRLIYILGLKWYLLSFLMKTMFAFSETHLQLILNLIRKMNIITKNVFFHFSYNTFINSVLLCILYTCFNYIKRLKWSQLSFFSFLKLIISFFTHFPVLNFDLFSFHISGSVLLGLVWAVLQCALSRTQFSVLGVRCAADL